MFEHPEHPHRDHLGDPRDRGDGRGPRRRNRDFDDLFGWPPGRGHRRPGGGRMRRGEIRTAVLAILLDGPGHGYDLIQRLEEKSGGWRPSPGSVYPTLQLLEDEDLVRSSERDGKRIFELTETGRAEATQRIEEAGGAPWERDRNAGPKRELRDEVGQTFLAFKQVATAGSPAQLDRALAVLKDARKQMYQILGED